MRSKSILDIDKDLKAKKAKSTRLANSSFMFNARRDLKKSTTSKFVSKKLNFNTLKKSTNIVVKVTGGASTTKGIKNAINYVARNGELSVYDQNLEAYDDLDFIKDDFTDELFLYSSNDKKIMTSMIFSAPPDSKVTKEDSLLATSKAIKSVYPNANFLMTYHNDTEDHPHVHLNLKLIDSMGKKFNLRKADLERIKTNFANELTKLNYVATHKSRHTSIPIKLKEKNKFTVLESGIDSYQFDASKKSTPFIKLQTHVNKAEFYVWGVDLHQKIKDLKIEVGDEITLKKGDKIQIKVPTFDENGKNNGMKNTFRNNWIIENITKKLRYKDTTSKDEIITYDEATKNRKIKQAKDLKKVISMKKLGIETNIKEVQITQTRIKY